MKLIFSNTVADLAEYGDFRLCRGTWLMVGMGGAPTCHPCRNKELKKKEKLTVAIGARNRLCLTAHNHALGQCTCDNCLLEAPWQQDGWLQAKITPEALVQSPSAGCGALRTEYLLLHHSLGGKRNRMQGLAGNHLAGLGHPRPPGLTALS